jgi:ParB family chromosome partitioning protein
LLDDTLLPEGVDDGTYDHGGHKLKAREEVAKCYGLSGTVVERYVRMNRLIKPLLDRLDNGEFPLLAAVEASVLKPKEQEMLDELLKDGKYQLTTAKAKLFRSPWRDEETGLISNSKMEEYLTDSPQAPVSVSVKVKQDVLTRYFGEDESADDISDTIAKALDMWFAARKAEAES